MDKVKLITYLRQNCIVQNVTTGNDPAFLALTDEQLELVLDIALSKESPSNTLDDVPNDITYPLVLVAKKELYYQLASKSAPLYPMSADNNSLKKNIRFEHYVSLIKQAESEYVTFKTLLTPVTTGEVFLNTRYFSRRNYEHQKPPSISLVLDNVYKNKVEISWVCSNITRFYNYLLYKSEETILDLYSQDSLKVLSGADKVANLSDIHSTRHRIENLKESTLYHVAVIVQEANGLKGFAEISFTTLL